MNLKELQETYGNFFRSCCNGTPISPDAMARLSIYKVRGRRALYTYNNFYAQKEYRKPFVLSGVPVFLRYATPFISITEAINKIVSHKDFERQKIGTLKGNPKAQALKILSCNIL